MRVLLIVANRNMATRETYTMVLRRDFPGWGVSHMSGLPPNPASILRGYDLIVYELFAADDPRRYREALALWDEIKGFGDMRMVTHVEGPYRDAMVAELLEHGVVVVDAPFSDETVVEALRRAAPTVKNRRGAAGNEAGKNGFLRGLFGGKR